jgi:hypothetical protein
MTSGFGNDIPSQISFVRGAIGNCAAYLFATVDNAQFAVRERLNGYMPHWLYSHK